MKHRVVFDIPFVEGKRRPRASSLRGHAHVYKDPHDVALERTIAAAFADAGGEKADRGEPVHLWVTTFKPIPARAPKRIEEIPDVTKPDIDNVVKLVMDALNGVAWDDDAQVTFVLASKAPRERGDNRPFTSITVDWGEDD